MMGTFFGTLVGFVLGLVLAGAAFIDIISTDNERGYQPNKPLNGPPPTRGTAYKNYLMTRRGIRRR